MSPLGRDGKLESTRFSGVALPFPRHCEANTARSGGSIFSSVAFRVRFHTPSASKRRSTAVPRSLTMSAKFSHLVERPSCCMLTDLRMRNILKIFSAQRESDRAAKNIEPDALNTAIRSVAILVDSQVAFGSRAADVAGQLGPSAIEMLVSRLHTPSCPTPETFESGVRGLGAWLTAWQFAVFEILFHFRSSAVEVLRRIAWGEYDWTQGNALEILVRLAAEGIGRDVMTADFHQNFRTRCR